MLLGSMLISTILSMMPTELKLCVMYPFNNSTVWLRTAAELAVEHINSGNTTFVPGATLAKPVYVDVLFYDQGSASGSGNMQVFDSALDCVSKGGQAIIGPSFSSRCEILSQYVLRTHHVPAISFSATSSSLSDDEAYPFFSRTIVPDDAITFAATEFILSAKWTQVAVLYSDEAFGQGLYEAFLREPRASELSTMLGCPFDPEEVADGDFTSLDAAFKAILSSGIGVVIFAGVADLPAVLTRAQQRGLIGEGWTWLGLDTFSPPPGYEGLMHGSIQLQASGCPQGPSFGLLGGRSQCNLGFIYDAVWLSALAFSTLPNISSGGDDFGTRFQSAIVTTEFVGASGLVKLLSNGDRDPQTVHVSVENHLANGSEWIGDIASAGSSRVDFKNIDKIKWADGSNRLPSDTAPHIIPTAKIALMAGAYGGSKAIRAAMYTANQTFHGNVVLEVTQYEWTSQAEMWRLATDIISEGMHAVLGPPSSGSSLTLAEPFLARSIPCVAGECSYPTHTPPLLSLLSSSLSTLSHSLTPPPPASATMNVLTPTTIFSRVVPTDNNHAKAFARVLYTSGYKTFAIVHDEDDSWAVNFKDDIRTYAQEMGVTATFSLSFRSGSSFEDRADLITESFKSLKQKCIHAIVAVFAPSDVAEEVMRVAAEVGVAGGGYQWIYEMSSCGFAQHFPDGTLGVNHGFDLTTAGYLKYQSALRAVSTSEEIALSTGVDLPCGFDHFYYDAFLQLAHAIRSYIHDGHDINNMSQRVTALFSSDLSPTFLFPSRMFAWSRSRLTTLFLTLVPS
jgi:ABC-type branched-subunit amino acid transport system substrate-binding protein